MSLVVAFLRPSDSCGLLSQFETPRLGQVFSVFLLQVGRCRVLLVYSSPERGLLTTFTVMGDRSWVEGWKQGYRDLGSMAAGLQGTVRSLDNLLQPSMNGDGLRFHQCKLNLKCSQRAGFNPEEGMKPRCRSEGASQRSRSCPPPSS